MLKELERLHALGFSLHWLRPESKAPLKSNWTKSPKESLGTLKREFAEGYGLGVKLGETSELPCGNYLANIDVDIKSSDPRHRKEALAYLKKRFGNALKNAPIIKTGYGFRFVIKTKEPLQSGKLTASSETCKVFMPHSDITETQRKSGLTEDELNKGYRIRPAWELEFMSAGRQVVLPPTIHPDTQEPYEWAGHPLNSADDIPLIDDAKLAKQKSTKEKDNAPKFEAVDFDVLFSDIPDSVAEKIIEGKGVTDRSAACQSVCNSLVRLGLTDNEILSILTNKDYYLGHTAYDHRQTNNRAVAADWVRSYCLEPAKKFMSARSEFAGLEIDSDVKLSITDKVAQKNELCPLRPWQERLQRSGKDGDGPIKPSFENTYLILNNIRGSGLFLKDAFAGREFYGKAAPWQGGEKGKTISDADYINIKVWLVNKFKMEPNVNTIYEAVTAIANQNAFHPVKEELEALPPWDGVPRLDTWLIDGFGAEGPGYYLAEVMRKWLVAAITRIYEPGAKFDWLPIFEGNQGAGKSSFGVMLFGQKYFTDRVSDFTTKDAAAELDGVRCVELAELDSFRKNELETVKAFISRQVDKYRPAFERNVKEQRRSVVFYGTTNKSEYLKDDTGNRRFAPVRVGRLDFKKLEAEKAQLWAEAKYIHDHELEHSLDFSDRAKAHLGVVYTSKMVTHESDLMCELLRKFITKERAKPSNEQFPFHRFSNSDLFSDFGPFARFRPDGKYLQFAARAMRKLDDVNAVPVVTKRGINGRMLWTIDIDNWVVD